MCILLAGIVFLAFGGVQETVFYIYCLLVYEVFECVAESFAPDVELQQLAHMVLSAVGQKLQYCLLRLLLVLFFGQILFARNAHVALPTVARLLLVEIAKQLTAAAHSVVGRIVYDRKYVDGTLFLPLFVYVVRYC